MTRILIVDDHPVLRHGLRALLESRPGWEVCGEASDGRDAVRLAEALQPDVVVMDLTMPGLNGLDALRQIKTALPPVEILVFTVNDSELAMREAIRHGARGFVLKSEVKEQLFAAVEALSRHYPYFAGSAAQTVLDGFLRGAGAETAPGPPLTSREREVVQLLAEGQGNKAIAETLSISAKTVDGHRTSAMRKLGVHSLAELIRYAIRNGLAAP
ncbi:MAG: response regulator transcription factor [Thermomicrobiales bacterium]|nr:response regulator transcription factor [Thermomicrobiales bacterium]